MRINHWLKSSVIGASLAGWIAIGEFFYLASGFPYTYSKHHLTPILASYVVIGCLASLLTYRIGIGVPLCLFLSAIINNYYTIETPVSISLLSILCIAIFFISKHPNRWVFRSFFTPFPHMISCLILAIILTICATDTDSQQIKGKPNIILFVLDDVDAMHFGINGYPRATTPNIDRIARDGARFIQKGENLIYDKNGLATTVTDDLKDSGYFYSLLSTDRQENTPIKFDAWVNVSAPPIDKLATFNFISLKQMSAQRNVIREIQYLQEQALANQKASLIICNFTASQRPYQISSKAENRFSSPLHAKGSLEEAVAKYDESIWSQDQIIGELCENFKEKNLYESTIIIIAGNRLPKNISTPSSRSPLIIRYPKKLNARQQIKGNLDNKKISETIINLLKT